MRQDSGLRPQGRQIPLGYLVPSREPDPSTVVEFDKVDLERPTFISRADAIAWEHARYGDCVGSSAKAIFFMSKPRHMPLPPVRLDVVAALDGRKKKELESISYTDLTVAWDYIRRRKDAEILENYIKRPKQEAGENH